MYWVKNEDGTYEVLDGQQRTISICEYVAGNFSLNFQYFHNLEDVEREQILDYKIMVYFCEWNDREKLDWFKTINIAGEKLTDQELRNAIYTGTWLTDAKKYFSKSGCPAFGMGSDYMNGSPIRQDYLETAISWLSGDKIEEYMSRNQHEPNAFELWSYFQNVITWTSTVFPNYRKEMKWVAWGILYNSLKDTKFDAKNSKMKSKHSCRMRMSPKNLVSMSMSSTRTNERSVSEPLQTNKNEKHTRGKVVSAQNVANILRSKRWRQTISRRGLKEGKQQRIIVRCFVKIVIVQNRGSNIEILLRFPSKIPPPTITLLVLSFRIDCMYLVIWSV